MENQPRPQHRPWFRRASLARPIQPPAPAPAPRPQMQPPAAPLPRPGMTRPTFRPPIGTQPQPGQDAPPPLQPPRPRAPPPSPPSVTPASVLPSLPPVRVAVSPVSPPKALPMIQKSPLASPVTQKSPPYMTPVTRKSPFYVSPDASKSPPPVTQKSPLTSPVAQGTPVTQKSPVSQKSPTPRPSPVRSTIPSPSSLPSSPRPRTLSPPPSFPSSPSPPPKPAYPYAMQITSPTLPSSPKPSNGLVSATSNPPSGAPMPTPETPPESPKIKSALHSPPFFSLPPPQLKSDGEHERKIPAISEQKTMLHVQDTVGKPRSFLKPYGNSDDIGMRVITISGENRGAIMELGYSSKRHGNPRKLKSEGELSQGKSHDNEGRSEIQGRNHNARAKPSTPTHAFMNSNVQGINSSIVLNSTLSHHDPGVHLSLTRKPVKGHHEEHSNGHNVFRKEGGQRFSD